MQYVSSNFKKICPTIQKMIQTQNLESLENDQLVIAGAAIGWLIKTQ